MVAEVRAVFIDFVIGVQEHHLQGNTDSNGNNSQASSSSNDELGSLVDLLVREFDLVQCLLKVGHIIRVWL